jgi:hypothetical protein
VLTVPRNRRLTRKRLRTCSSEGKVYCFGGCDVFDLVYIGPSKFADAGFGANYPVHEVEGKAPNIFCSGTGDLKQFVILDRREIPSSVIRLDNLQW